MTLYAGEVFLLKTKIWIDGVLDDPDSCKITITKTAKTGTPIIDAEDMTQTSTGIYKYSWDSDGQTSGTFYAKFHAANAGASGNWEWKAFKLI